MSGINKAILIGNLGQDPELKYTQRGSAVLTMRLAINETWRDGNGEKQERVEWLTCVMWGKRAEGVAKFLAKGHRVYIEGRIQTRSWEDRDGKKRYSTEINVSDLQALGGRGSTDGASRGRGRTDGNPSNDSGDDFGGDGAGGDFGDDDIPFATVDVVRKAIHRIPRWERF